LLTRTSFNAVAGVGLDVDQSGRVVNATHADLVYVEGLNHVKYLYAGRCQITDAGLEHLRNLTEMRQE
jgi:hypothetical protein